MRPALLAALAFGCVLTAAPLAAAPFVLDFQGVEDDPIPNSFGAQPGLSLSYRNLAGPGNVSLAASGRLLVSNRQYGDLAGVARTGANGTTGEIRFNIDPGYSLTIDSVRTAGAFGADRPTEFRIYDTAYNQLWTSGNITAPGTGNLLVQANITRTFSLIFQWGPDSLGAGIDRLSYTLVAPDTGVPEPASLALLVAGLGMLGMAPRRRLTPPPG